MGRVEATMTAEISTMRLDIGDIQEALKNHDSWMEDVSNTLQQMQEKEENLTEDIINLKNEMNTKLDTKVDNVAWKEANDDLDAAIKTVRDMVSSLRLDVDARRRKVDEILATIRHDITAVETNLEEPAREARARVVERGGGAPPAAAFATGSLLEGQRGCRRRVVLPVLGEARNLAGWTAAIRRT